MASVDRSVCRWLRSEDLLHAGLVVVLLLGEFVSSSTLSLLAGALFPNSFVSLSFSTISSLLLFILSILLSFLRVVSVLHSCHGKSALFGVGIRSCSFINSFLYRHLQANTDVMSPFMSSEANYSCVEVISIQ